MNWTTRYGASPDQIDSMNTTALRGEFLIESIFVPGEARMGYTHIDRMVVGGIVPTREAIAIGDGAEVGTDHFFDAREAGIANLGHGAGSITVDGETFELASRDVLYIGRGARDVQLRSADAGNPALFYLNSVPAGADIPHRLITRAQSKMVSFGTPEKANHRDLRMYIHPEVAPSCLLLMGITDPSPGNVWNTMPPHQHNRRNEVYFYFNVPEEQAVCHIMGQPQETRHLWMHNEQAVISPNWSIHSAAGTSNYIFIWGMAGENLDYTDMDHIKPTELR